MTPEQILDLVEDHAQRMRSHGETDMRSVIHHVSGLRRAIKDGKTYEQIIAEREEDEDDED